MRAEASLDHNRREAPARLSLSSLQLKPQLEPEWSYPYHELDASVGDVFLGTVGDVFLDEDKMKACSLVSVDASETSLGQSGSQLTHGVYRECELSLLQPWKTLHHTADNSLDICKLCCGYGGYVAEEKTSDSHNSIAY